MRFQIRNVVGIIGKKERKEGRIVFLRDRIRPSFLLLWGAAVLTVRDPENCLIEGGICVGISACIIGIFL